MARTRLLPLLCLAPLTLGACESLKPRPQIVASPDKVSLMLVEAADKTSTAMQTLAAVEAARTPDIAVGGTGNAPAELRRAMTLAWTGPVEPVARRLAERASYGFMVLGAPPPVPPVVALDVENRPVIDILRDIGLQLGSRADIRVDSNRRMVELQYAPNTGAGG
jgi:defect-in-organelle-trafficking protein DotD